MRRQCNGAKRYTEATESYRRVWLVGEHSMDRRRWPVRVAGGDGRENAGISTRKDR